MEGLIVLIFDSRVLKVKFLRLFSVTFCVQVLKFISLFVLEVKHLKCFQTQSRVSLSVHEYTRVSHVGEIKLFMAVI